ncbi:MAG: M42 family metallopeptidase [Verrucomicrobiota bacterium]
MMDNGTLEFLFQLLNTPSPTGFESPGQRVWADRMRETADQVESDAYGNVWATLEGKKEHPTVMLEAHADEIGYMVKYITDEGYLHLDRIGGSDWMTARGRRLNILGDKGEVPGIIGNTAIHIRDSKDDAKALEVHELYVDIGADSAEEVADMGVRIGHPAVYSDSSKLLGKNRIVGRALDNRVGGFIISEVMKKLAAEKKTLGAQTIALNAVQEEIGGWGAKMAAYRLFPDVCLVLDVTHATDTPGIDHTKHGKVTLGGGPTLTHGSANHPMVVERLMQVAKDLGMEIQHEASSRYTGTDTDSIFHMRKGIPSALVSLPLRYMHSVVEQAHMDDIAEVIDLMTAFVRSIEASDEFKVAI